MLRTYLGPVGLRRQRDEVKIRLHAENREVLIKKGWLHLPAKASKEQQIAHLQTYRTGVMQAMMIAATHMELEDVTNGVSIDPETGLLRTPEKVREHAALLNSRLEKMKNGSAPVPMRRLSVAQGVSKQDMQGLVAKYVLMKRSHKVGLHKWRWFSIDNGKLKVFRYHGIYAKAQHVYELYDCECRYENEQTPGLAEPFTNGFKDRLKIQLRERPHGPLYLYDEDAKRVKSWERAVKMSKYLQSASDREALAYVVGRLAGSIMNKGWQALFCYKKEMQDTRHLVKNLAMRLMRVDLSRGWTKARMVYTQKIESDHLRKEQQEWAAKFLKEKMERIGTQTARTPRMVRQSIIHQIQTKFRHYRQEKIFDRAYPLGSSVATRPQQAQAGTTMGAAFASLTRDDALHLVLNDESRMLLTTRPDVFHCKKSTYSAVKVPVGQLHVNISESFAMLSFAELDEEAEHSHLAKAGWAHFVNLDQISSVVLHTERVMSTAGGRPELPPSMCGGVWFTVNGPRVCWCRQLRTYVDHKTKEVRKDLVGATNPLVVGSALAKGERLRWFKVAVQVRGAHIPTARSAPDQGEEQHPFPPEEGPQDFQLASPKRAGRDRHTYLVLHLLGRRFRSEPVLGDSPVYPGRFEAEVPISYDEQALAALDESEVGVDIVEWAEEPQVGLTIYAGKLPLWKVFATDGAEHALGAEKGEVLSLAQTLSASTGRAVARVPLVHPEITSEEFRNAAGLEIEVTARVQESADPGRRCISPELQGRGPLTALFSTHRGAWFDPKLGEAKFLADRVANFVEVAVKDFIFPANDRADPTKLFRYHVAARCNGVTASTMPLYRPREIWSSVVRADPTKLDFQGTKLFLPLPPGAWCANDVRPEIEVVVLRCAQSEEKMLSFSDLISQNGKPGPPPPSLERAYHATVSLDGLVVDQVKEGARILLGKATLPAVMVNLASGEYSQVDQPAVLVVHAALRDRDYVRLHAAGRGTSNELGQGSVLCVGDKAMMRVEEPLRYPQSELEFRRRALPGTFDANLTRRGPTAWSAPLREPSMSHEYAASRMEALPNPPPFKQRYLPTNCEDVIPYRFLLPPGELQFLREARPGVFWRIADGLAEKSAKDRPGATQDAPRQAIVEELTHLVRHVPCTVLAVYANETCDLEVAPSFVNDWERHPERQYTVPGAVVVRKFQDLSAAAMRTAPVGSGDIADRYRLRVLLREVPIGNVTAVQAAGFNIYDASFGSVEDAIKVPPGQLGNDFNPRLSSDVEAADLASGRRGGYAVHAGPVPADAGPTCLYEWSLHLHAASEDDMCHFVTALRQSARMDLFQQLLKLDDWKKKSAMSSTSMPYRMGPLFTTASGHMEVVLVEARHLRPPHLMRDKDMASAATRMMAAELSPLAIFRMRNGEDGEELIYRGSKSQSSPSVHGDSPDWSKVEELEKSGGWVFKSPPFDPSQMKDLHIELELKHKRLTLGLLRVPVAAFRPKGSGPAVNLCNPEEPFHNIWVPLSTRDKATGELVPAATGMVHIMTLWIPQQQTTLAKRLPKKAVDWRHFQLRPKLLSSQVREPLHQGSDVQVQKAGYNPNLWRDQWPQSRCEAHASHIEVLADTAPYLDGCDAQDRCRWKSFLEELPDDEDADGRKKSLGVRRLEWTAVGPGANPSLAYEADQQLRRGVPPPLRKHLWLEVTLADLCMEDVPEAGSLSSASGLSHLRAAYRALVEHGRPFRSEAMAQLQEDLVSASDWDSTVMDAHLVRVRRAQDICIALITFSQDAAGPTPAVINYSATAFRVGADPMGMANGVAYCESLLYLAFHMLLAVSADEDDGAASNEAKGKSTATFQPTAAEDEEVRIFWLLYALAGSPRNRAFRDYYGTVPEGEVADRRGAMEDIHRLNICLARYESELWLHLNALGFHLATVFYGAFMRLFATYLPEMTCFRFWDMLLSETAPRQDRAQQKPARHSLIDLAFGALRQQKAQLMRCNSALEAKDAIVDSLERLYEPAAVVALASEAERFLWDLPLQSAAEAVGMASMHTRDYERAVGLWEQHLYQFRRQNLALKDLIASSGDQLPPKAVDAKDPRLTTRSITAALKTLRGLFGTEGLDRSRFLGMQRSVPARIRKIGPEIDRSFVGTLSSWFSRMTETVMVDTIMMPIAVSVPRPLEIPDTNGEPTTLDSNDFQRQLTRVANTWGPYIEPLFQAFVSQNERRLSMNEFFTALICCSRGTVGEKAMALFAVYGSAQNKHTMHHVTPVTHAATTVVSKVDGDQRKMEGILAKAPIPQEVKAMALHFKVFTHSMGRNEILMGEVYIPTLRPFIWSSMGRDNPQNFSIWGLEKRLPPGMPMNSGNAALLLEAGIRPQIGTISMAIKWMAQSEGSQEVGQLGIHLYHISFNKKLVEAHEFKNPRVTVVMYDDQGEEVQIKRWDPRSAARRGASAVTADMAYGGAYGEHVEFVETMRLDSYGQLWHRKGSGAHHGWDSSEGLWRWSNKWGDQFSVEGLRIRKAIVGSAGSRPNTISLRACRLITSNILARSLHCVTNRQAMHIADQAFNRAGAVPGILDAILVQAENVSPTFQSAAHLRAALDEARKSYVDVTHQVVLLHEETIDRFPGNTALFPSTIDATYNLSTMEIADPFAGSRKVLWIRYVRAGDGQRFNAPIPVGPEGSFPAQDIQLDMEVETAAGKMQMSVTKEEFVTCILSNPLLSEGLRQLSTTNNSLKGVPVQTSSMKLDVLIADPTGEEEEDDFMDAMNVRQGICFEVWDKDLATRDDFLGECWLPSLGSLSTDPRQFVLPVRNAPDNGDATASRPDGKKRIGDAVCTGDLYVEASWRFPHKEVDDTAAEEDLEERVRREEVLHTGELYLKIIKATNLRSADVRRQRGSDPYVIAYVRNETNAEDDEVTPGIDKGGWRTHLTTGIHEPLMKTNWQKATVNPVWEEEQKILLLTGAFERRTKRGTNYLAITSRSKQRGKDVHAMDVLAGREGDGGDLRLYFGDSNLAIGQTNIELGKSEGYRHNVKVYLTESIHQFKTKLMLACEKEAALEKDPKKAAKYKIVSQGLHYRHAVMVFVPSQRLRELAQQQRTSANEYRRLYRLEEQDPSSWQPLDTIRTFDHYSAVYGFGLELPQRLRVSEGTDDYKLKNTRYRQFDEDQKSWSRRVVDLNTGNECFGYAKYVHRGDANAEEWRQAIIERPEGFGYGYGPGYGGEGKRRFKTWFIHSPASGNPSGPGSAGLAPGQAPKEELDWDSLLPAHAHPRMLGSGNLEHQEFLSKAQQYRDAEGLGETEITARLNNEMKAKYANVQPDSQDRSVAGQPPAITLADVQHALKRENDSTISPQALPRRMSR